VKVLFEFMEPSAKKALLDPPLEKPPATRRLPFGQDEVVVLPTPLALTGTGLELTSVSIGFFIRAQ
jgi:hypothetical protein